MNKNQWGGIFIAVIMVGSILGFALMFSGNQSEDTNPDDLIDSNLPSSTVMNMSAEGIEAKTVEILPKILFSAYTNEAEIQEINAKIALVPGIYKIESKYRQQENTSFGTSLVYIAEISFDKSKNIGEMGEGIINATEDILFDPFYFEVVLLSVPKNIKFSNEQGFELNYEYQDPLTLAYVLPGTQKDDLLSIRIDASFTGNTLVSSFASALSNLTSEPQIHSFDLNKTVEEKLSRIVFGSIVNYSDYTAQESLKEQILALSNAVDANVVSYKPENYFTVFFDAETDLKEEFSQLMADNNDSISSVEVFEAGQGFSAEIFFLGNNSSEAINLVKDFLETNTALDISVTESNAQAFASIALDSADSAQFVSELNALLEQLNFSQSQIQQEVVVEFDSFVSEEGTEFFPDEQTVTEVFVSPQVQAGEEVGLKAEIETSRDKILSIRAASE